MPSQEPRVEPHVIIFTDIHYCTRIHDELGERTCDFLQETYEVLGDAIVWPT